MLVQEEMIVRLRHLCKRDTRVTGALLGGSFSQGEGDEFSDLDAVLFFRDEALPELDQRAWLSQIAPIALYFDDDFGHRTAIFENLVRGEFHFAPASTMALVESWYSSAWLADQDSALLVDRTGRLAQHLQRLIGPAPGRDSPERVQALTANFLNAILFGVNVLTRGKAARALEVLGLVQRNLLWMTRLVEGRTVHWPTPSRAVKQDLPPAAYTRYVSCTAALHPDALWGAYCASSIWGNEMLHVLLSRHELPTPHALLERLEQRVTDGHRSPTAAGIEQGTDQV